MSKRERAAYIVAKRMETDDLRVFNNLEPAEDGYWVEARIRVPMSEVIEELAEQEAEAEDNRRDRMREEGWLK